MSEIKFKGDWLDVLRHRVAEMAEELEKVIEYLNSVDVDARFRLGSGRRRRKRLAEEDAVFRIVNRAEGDKE